MVQFLQNITQSLTIGILNISDISIVPDSVDVEITPILSMDSSSPSPTESPVLFIWDEHSHDDNVLVVAIMYITAAVVVSILCGCILYITITRTSKHLDDISSLVRDPHRDQNRKRYEKVRAHSEDPHRDRNRNVNAVDVNVISNVISNTITKQFQLEVVDQETHIRHHQHHSFTHSITNVGPTSRVFLSQQLINELIH